MHLHVLGIGGTFMSALAILAREAGFTVTGSDANCYSPVSDLLAAKGIEWTEGYERCDEALKADQVIVGNAIKRGMPVIEAVMNAHQSYTSGPEWLANTILPNYRVMAVAGTHGKTTTTSMLAHILNEAGLDPAFLIGGVAPNFNTSARLGKGQWFVIEADEYDSAFFDKRPKFMHYRPDVAILNNLEFDHADIYANLEAIQLQFHYLMKCIPSNGMVIKPLMDKAVNEVVSRGQFCQVKSFSSINSTDWQARIEDECGSVFSIFYRLEKVATVEWSLIGRFNVENGLAAMAAGFEVGVTPDRAAASLASFQPVKRRLEVKGRHHDITIYDDFAHHPTAIFKTVEALKQSHRHKRILVVMEFASYTMKTGVHADKMSEALVNVDKAFILNPADFSLQSSTCDWKCAYHMFSSTEEIISAVVQEAKPNDAILIMSNRGFDNIHQRLGEQLKIR